MRRLVSWAVSNTAAMNVVVVAVLAVGIWSVTQLRREFWPAFEIERINVTVAYPGAAPEEIEEGILEKVEEAVRSLDGIIEITSTAVEGSGTVSIELEDKVGQAAIQKLLGEVRSQVDAIPSLPELAEQPVVVQRTYRVTAIRVGVLGPDDDSVEARLRLREVAEEVRDQILDRPSVTQAEIQGATDYQIDVEVSEDDLRRYGLSLSEVADRIRGQNLDLPGGVLKTRGQDVLLRGRDRRKLGEGIAGLPLVTRANGTVLSVGDVAEVKDEFSDAAAVSEINGRPALAVSVDTTDREDIIQISGEVRDWAATAAAPPGFEIVTYRDRSLDVESRLDLLAANGWQGLLLVFLVLTLFLETRLAFWVALGIPISLLGACAVMLYTGQTLNMTSMFAFLVALGIVVDDAIIVGENVYRHREIGKPLAQAAVDGTVEVLPSVVTSVSTTIVAFLPLMFLTGRLGLFTSVLPLAVIAMLVISLLESMTVLPSHLGHADGPVVRAFLYAIGPLALVGRLLGWMNRRASAVLDRVVDGAYVPLIRSSLRAPSVVIATALGLFIVCAGLVRSGQTPFVLMPRIDFDFCYAYVNYPDGTPLEVTDAQTRAMEAAALRVSDRLASEGRDVGPGGAEPAGRVVTLSHRTVGFSDSDASGAGGHSGGVMLVLTPTERRTVTSHEFAAAWREEVGPIAGAQSVSYAGGPGGPTAPPIEVRLMARAGDLDQLQSAVAAVKAKLAEYPSVSDITTTQSPGKWQYRIGLREDAASLGVTLADVGGAVRAAYYGEEVMRLQRGRHEVQLRVRYPAEERRTLADFDRLRVRTADGAERPVTELADIEVDRDDSKIERVDQMRSIVVVCDVNEETGNAFDIVADLRASFAPQLLADHPGVRLRWEGQQEQTNESVSGMTLGFLLALCGMFLILTIEFGSYLRSLLILAVIPFGTIGAVAGHVVMGFPITLFSVFGLVALSGVVVNDSIVLVDFIARALKEGRPLEEALVESGRRRFRPVLLTSLTTICGMTPILLETSRQASVVQPMAVSLVFGLSLATLLVLVLVPTLFLVAERAARAASPEHGEVGPA